MRLPILGLFLVIMVLPQLVLTANFVSAQSQAETPEEREAREHLERIMRKDKKIDPTINRRTKGTGSGDPFAPKKPDPNSPASIDPNRGEGIHIPGGVTGGRPIKIRKEVLDQSEIYLKGRLEKQLKRFEGKIDPSEIGDRLIYIPSDTARRDPLVKSWEEKRWNKMVEKYKDQPLEVVEISGDQMRRIQELLKGGGSGGGFSGSGQVDPSSPQISKSNRPSSQVSSRATAGSSKSSVSRRGKTSGTARSTTSRLTTGKPTSGRTTTARAARKSVV